MRVGAIEIALQLVVRERALDGVGERAEAELQEGGGGALLVDVTPRREPLPPRLPVPGLGFAIWCADDATPSRNPGGTAAKGLWPSISD